MFIIIDVITKSIKKAPILYSFSPFPPQWAVSITYLLRIRHKSLTPTKNVRIKSTALTYLFIIHKLDTNSKHFITIRINSPPPPPQPLTKKYRQIKPAAIPRNSKRIQRAYNAKRPFDQDVGVNHCGFYISMPKQFLNCPDVRAAFQKVCGK